MSEKKIPNWGKKSQPQNNVRRVDVDEFDVGNGTLREVDKKSLYPDPNQPRRTFNDESLVELKESIETNGLLQPIIVCEVDNDDGIGKYRIIAGERRWRAAMLSDRIERVAIVIRSDISDTLKVLLAQIAENIHRENMSVIETAACYKKVLDAVDGNTEKAISLLNISKTRFSTTIGLNKSDANVKKLAEEGITKDVDTLAALNVLAKLSPEKANDTVEQIRSGEISEKGMRKTVTDLVREEKKSKSHVKDKKIVKTPEVTVDDPEVLVSEKSDDDTVALYAIELTKELMGDLVTFLKEKENTDDYLLIKKVLVALENAKKKGD